MYNCVYIYIYIYNEHDEYDEHITVTRSWTAVESPLATLQWLRVTEAVTGLKGRSGKVISNGVAMGNPSHKNGEVLIMLKID